MFARHASILGGATGILPTAHGSGTYIPSGDQAGSLAAVGVTTLR